MYLKFAEGDLIIVIKLNVSNLSQVITFTQLFNNF